ncbi:MAG: DegT/DnrJ/EryC1/StrS family aminotransferase [Nitrosopumilus sp.]|nr:DegT/DnrJ/EryC1/StrS family aminotransferase [Nitrosopumilus sp.]
MKKIKLFDPIITAKEEQAVIKTLKSKFWASGSGSGNVLEFEKKFNKYTEAKRTISVNSGTAALHLALSLVNVKNKEVILPSLSFVSTANAIIYNGGIPKFVDVDPTTLCLDPLKVSKAINKNTKVILPVHFGGLPAKLDEFVKLCKKNNLKLIEDAAHAVGSTFKNKKIGSHGFAVCFSFHPVKNLAMPTGGAITLNEKDVKKYEELLKSRRWCGITNRKGVKYDVNELGWNYYMNEFSAAIGIEQLKKLDKLNKKRKNIAKRYFEEIKLSGKMPLNQDSSYHLYWIRVPKRDSFMQKMNENNIETGIHYLPIHKMKLFNSKQKLPITEKICSEIVSIPIHPNLSESDISRIINSVNKYA